MQLLRDRFVIVVVIITAMVIGAMFIVHRARDMASRSEYTEGASPGANDAPLPSRGPFRVARVLDGDTIVLDNNETVRLIGVDTPELHHPEVPVQRFGEEAAEFVKRLVEGRECTLEYEPDDMRDHYGRQLAYVFAAGKLVNAEIIRRGYGYAYTRFPFRRQAEFVALEKEAREHQYGLWNLSLRDGRIANLANRYESLSREGRQKLDELIDELARKYPTPEQETVDEPQEKTKE